MSDFLIKLFSSYLIGRTQVVTIGGFQSTEVHVTSGVPQGSILGPLFFILFINDISIGFSSECLLYADDLKIFRKITTFSDHLLLQADLYKLEQACNVKGLSLNLPKCSVMTYSLKHINSIYEYKIGGFILKRVSTVRDLGIIFDQKLSFIDHYDEIFSSSIRALGFIIRNCKSFQLNSTLLSLYTSFVRSKLEYGCVIWSPGYDVHCLKLEKLQRKFLKFLHFKSFGYYPCRGFPQNELLVLFSIQSLEKRRETLSLCFLFKLVNGVVNSNALVEKLCFLVPRSNIRNPLCFYTEISRTNVHVFSPITTMCRIYNNYRNKFDIFNCSLRQIKNAHL